MESNITSLGSGTGDVAVDAADITISQGSSHVGSLSATLIPTRTMLTPPAWLIYKVMALAVFDCKRALKASATGFIKPQDLAEAASACRFFLSEEGQALIAAAGFGNDGIREGIALARTTIDRLSLTEKAVLAGDSQSWKSVIEQGSLKEVPAVLATRRAGENRQLFAA